MHLWKASDGQSKKYATVQVNPNTCRALGIAGLYLQRLWTRKSGYIALGQTSRGGFRSPTGQHAGLMNAFDHHEAGLRAPRHSRNTHTQKEPFRQISNDQWNENISKCNKIKICQNVDQQKYVSDLVDQQNSASKVCWSTNILILDQSTLCWSTKLEVHILLINKVMDHIFVDQQSVDF